MFRSYVTIALRQLLTQKLYSALNIAGLAVGLACFMLIALFVRHELGFDRHYAEADRIYRVSRDFFPGGESALDLRLAGAPPRLGPLVKQEFPQIEQAARLYPGELVISRDDLTAYVRDYWADAGIFEIFDFEWLRGDPSDALGEPFSVVLTESMARRYFGDDDPVGRGMMVGDYGSAIVTGVIADLPANTHLRFDMLGSIATLETVFGPQFLEGWDNNLFHTYLLLSDGADAETIQRQSGEFFERHLEQGSSRFTGFTLMPVTDIHLRSNRALEMSPPGSTTSVYALATIGVFILLIACINFMNLATARSVQRAKEVGVRKSAGAERAQLVTQFLCESVLTALISVALGVALAELALPAFASFMQRDLTFAYAAAPGAWLALGTLALVVGVIAGSYPAVYLSAFQPTRVLRGDLTRGRGAAMLRRALVVTQFAISIVLLIGTVVVAAQMRFAREIDLGYDKEQVVVYSASPRSGLGERWETLKHEWLAHPEVAHAAASSRTPAGTQAASAGSVRFEGGDPDGHRGVPLVLVEHGFFEAYGIDVLAGRTFSEDFPADLMRAPTEQEPRTTAAYVLNARAARQFGWAAEEALGKWVEVSLGNRFQLSARGPVIGVVADAHFGSVRAEREPMVYFVPPREFLARVNEASVRIAGTRIRDTLEYLDTRWRELLPDQPVVRRFVDEDFAALHREEERQGQLFAVSSLLAIFVGCLGLVGLAAYTIERRRREIAVRKVMGGSVFGIVRLLTTEFSRLVLLANLIAWPVAYLLMQQWLASFAYRIGMGLPMFLAAGLVALVVAWITVAAVTVRAANARPVHSLRYE